MPVVAQAGSYLGKLMAKQSILMQMMYNYMINHSIEKTLTANCGGCRMDFPSQNDHLTGCLQPWDEAVHLYINEVHAKIGVDLVVRMYRKTMEELELPLLPMAIVFEAAKQLIQDNPPNVLSDKIRGQDNTPDGYRHVFSMFV